MYGFKAFVFNGKKTAGKAFDTLEDHMPVYPWIEDAAVVSRAGRRRGGRFTGRHGRRRRRDRL